MHFRPKITCQVLKQHNPIEINNIRMAYEFHSNRYNKSRAEKQAGNLQGLTY
jgi:hypothetical protein